MYSTHLIVEKSHAQVELSDHMIKYTSLARVTTRVGRVTESESLESRKNSTRHTTIFVNWQQSTESTVEPADLKLTAFATVSVLLV